MHRRSAPQQRRNPPPVFLLLDAIDIAEGTKQAPVTFTAQAYEMAFLLLSRLHDE